MAIDVSPLSLRFSSSALTAVPFRERALEDSRQIETRAVALLEAHPHFRGRSHCVECSCTNRRLYLGGKLPTYYLKQIAQEVMRQLDGVDQIVNRIVVSNSGSEAKTCFSARVQKATGYESQATFNSK